MKVEQQTKKTVMIKLLTTLIALHLLRCNLWGASPIAVSQLHHWKYVLRNAQHLKLYRRYELILYLFCLIPYWKPSACVLQNRNTKTDNWHWNRIVWWVGGKRLSPDRVIAPCDIDINPMPSSLWGSTLGGSWWWWSWFWVHVRLDMSRNKDDGSS